MSLLRVVLMLSVGLALLSCEQKGPVQKAGEKVDKAMEDAGKAIEKAGEKAAEKLDEGAKKIRDATR
jgi:hyperosmotically inducible protein